VDSAIAYTLGAGIENLTLIGKAQPAPATTPTTNHRQPSPAAGWRRRDSLTGGRGNDFLCSSAVVTKTKQWEGGIDTIVRGRLYAQVRRI
jgi:hypothetical protein